MLVGHITKVGTTLMKGKIRGRLTGTPDLRNPPGKPLAGSSSREVEDVPPPSHHDQPRASSRINDNYCVTKLQPRLLAGSIPQTINTGLNLNVKLPVASHVHSAPGHSQKRELSPGSAGCHYKNCKLKSVKSVSCVTQLSCAQPVTNVKNAAPNLPVGARLKNFWQTWLHLGAGPKVVQILKEGYTLPFRIRPRLTRSPKVISCYVNPHRNSYLLEALHQLIAKNAVELVRNQTSLGFFNRLFLVPKPNNKWRPILDLSNLNLFLKAEKFKMETQETIRTSLQQGEWVTSIDFKDTYFHIPIQEQSRKYLRFHVQGQTYQFKALPFGLSTLGVYCDSKGGETDGQPQGYKDPPVPRRLVGESHIPPGLSSTYSESGENMSKIRLAGEFGKVRAGSKADLRFCRLPVRPPGKSGPTDPRQVAKPSGQNIRNNVTATLSSSTVHVPDRVAYSHRKTSSRRPAAYEAQTVAPQAALENTRITRKSDSNSQLPAPSSTMVATGRQCPHRSTIRPNKACSANLYRCIKRRVGRSLKQIHCQRDLITARKQVAYKLFGTQGSVSCLKRVSKPLCKQDSTCRNRQHYSDVVYKQSRRHEVGHTLCPTMENLDLVYQTSSKSKSPTYPRLAECGSRQAIQTGPDHSNRMVPPSRGFPSYMQQVAPTSDRSICHEVQQQVTSVCVTSTGLLGSSRWENLDAYAFPPAAILGKVVERLQDSPCKRIILIAPGWPNMPWFWDLVTMSSQIPLSLPNLPNLLTQPFNQTPHRNLTNLNLHAWLLEPQQSRSRASLKQWQQGLRLLKEDQPDQSMRQNGPFLQSGASLIRWTSGHPQACKVSG